MSSTVMILKILHTIVIFMNLLLGIFVLFRNPKVLSNRLFCAMCLLSALWSVANYMTDIYVSVFWLSVTYSLGALLICAGLIWVIVLTEEKVKYKRILSLFFIGFLVCISSFNPHHITTYLIKFNPQITYEGNPNWGLLLFGIYYIIFGFLIIFKLYAAIKNAKDEQCKIQLKYILIGACATLSITTFTSLILPIFSIFIFSCVDSVGFLFFLLMITFSITKYHLFNIKVIMLEFIILGLWIFMLLRTVLAKTLHERLAEGSIFIIVVVLGGFLIQSVLRNIKHGEEIENLSNRLNESYQNQESE